MQSAQMALIKQKREFTPPGGVDCRVEMLGQYVRAVDETIASFQQAYRQQPEDEQLAKAFARFHHNLKRQLSRLEAMQPRLSNEKETQALERAIESVRQASQRRKLPALMAHPMSCGQPA